MIAAPAATADDLARETAKPGSLPFRRCEVFGEVAPALPAWTALEAACPATLFQTRRFALPWLAAFQATRGLKPMIAVAYDEADAPCALLALGVERRGPFSVASFLGGGDANAHLGLFRRPSDWSGAAVVALLRQAAARAGRRVDLCQFINQPFALDGVANPLAKLPHQPSPSFGHSATLGPDARAFVAARQSKAAAKKLRQKRQRLEAMGRLDYRVAAGEADIARVVDAFFAQKLARFHAKNIASVFDTSEARGFIEALARGDAPAIELHTLRLDERVIAVYGGGAHDGRFHALFNSFDADPEIAKSSPGDLLLQAMLERQCAMGRTLFDLGVGEARYKDAWCDAPQPLFDALIPVTLRGRLFALAEGSRLRLKRFVKQNPQARALALRLMRRG